MATSINLHAEADTERDGGVSGLGLLTFLRMDERCQQPALERRSCKRRFKAQSPCYNCKMVRNLRLDRCYAVSGRMVLLRVACVRASSFR